MALDQAREAVGKFQERVSLVPQVQSIFENGLDAKLSDEKESGIHYIARTYIGYLRVLKCISSLTDEEVRLVAATEEKVEADDIERAKSHGAEINKGSSAGFTHAESLQLLGEKRKELFELAVEGMNPESSIFAGAIEECSNRLIKGSHLFAIGEKATDDNPAFLDAYLGHTKNIPPRAMVHFIISHYLTRTFQARYNGDKDLGKLAFDKDSMHGVISVGIRIMKARGICPPEIDEMWRKRRTDGGLQWHNDKYDETNQDDPKQILYDKAFGGKE